MLTLALIKELSIEDLLAKLDETKRELYEARFKNATHQLQDTSVFKKLRHQAAQLQTVLRQKQLAS